MNRTLAGLFAGLLVAAFAAQAAAAEARKLTVFRGAVAEPAVAAGVTVLRGTGTAEETAPAYAPGPARSYYAAGGRRLWLADPETGEVTVCTLRYADFVDGREIVCTSGALFDAY